MEKRNWTDTRNLKDENAGFSLIEVILAMTILALISIPLMNYFTDSLRYSAQMANRQKATALAQQVTEEMKAETQLIRREPLADGTDGYQAPLLTAQAAEGGYGLSMTVPSGSSFRTDGKGEADFAGAVEFSGVSYDLRISLKAEEEAAPQQSAAYGVDDATDVMGLQRDQQAEAAVYFMAAQRDDCAKNGGVPWTYDQTLAHMGRRAYVDVGWEAGKGYTVKIWYEYSCPEAHAPSASYRGVYLADTRVESLKNIYLLYEKNGTENRDYVSVKLDAAAKNALDLAGLPLPSLHLICQDPAEDISYQLVLDQSGSAARLTDIRSNIRMADRTGKVSEVISGAEMDLQAEPLISIGAGARLVEIHTEVYLAGRTESGTALAVMETTKVE